MKRILVIFNPAASSGSKALAFRRFLDSRAGPHVTLAPTQGPGDATKLAAADQNHDLIVAAGGDGTINEVVNGIAGKTLGILPFGTVNVFTKELGIPANLAAAWRVLETGRPRAIDLGCAEFAGRTRTFVQLAGVGFDASAVRAVSLKLKRKVGPLSYIVAGLKILRTRHAPVDVGSGISGAAVLIGNGRYYGGKVRVFPRAKLDDGLLDVCVFEKFGAFEMLRYLPGILCGKHPQMAGVHYFKTAEFTCRTTGTTPFQLDGEDAGDGPIKFSVKPGALRVIVPA